MYGFCYFYNYISAHNSKNKVKQKILQGKSSNYFLLYLLDFELFPQHVPGQSQIFFFPILLFPYTLCFFSYLGCNNQDVIRRQPHPKQKKIIAICQHLYCSSTDWSKFINMKHSGCLCMCCIVGVLVWSAIHSVVGNFRFFSLSFSQVANRILKKLFILLQFAYIYITVAFPVTKWSKFISMNHSECVQIAVHTSAVLLTTVRIGFFFFLFFTSRLTTSQVEKNLLILFQLDCLQQLLLLLIDLNLSL